MSIVRLIFVKVDPDQSENAENVWKEHCAPLMIKEPGCMSEKLLRCTDDPGELISYSEWQDQESIDKYRKGKAHEEIKRHSDSLKSGRPVVKRYEVV
ncbi:MAG TPA: antibiotic biosynthesis monooxygenase family protein [Candidatus Limnocylindria bacterium]|nr:antibiotic biosynthesis monooxygenase family protein [Candidatus Limnocylindria bacterium]